ncbi:MAG TPA: sugar ABC transporter permease [Roseiflexaceae bacterium]|nr:sugar ABC transporter permease [Roseiflexaceae bacterium]HMP43062.1 sugar ABC transporter permease [Roseiflexaceae bacterium]
MATQTIPAPRSKADDRRTMFKEAKRNAWAYVFISPFYLLYAVFGMFPLAYGIWLSFHKWDGISPMQWVGLANYTKLLLDDIWWYSIYNTVWLFFAATVPQIILALILAFIINSNYIKGKDLFRAAYFMPIVASSVAVSLLFVSLFGQRYGLLNYFTSMVGLPQIDWLGDRNWLKPSMAIVIVWQWTGYTMIIFLAGLQSINTELYEAARVDGAETRDVFWKITMPLMRPVILFQVVLAIIGAMQNFDIPVMLAGGTQSSSPGGTDRSGLVAMVNLYWTAFKYTEFGYAAAMGFLLFVLIITFSYTYNRWQGGNPTD